jgi:hypothetical protein
MHRSSSPAVDVLVSPPPLAPPPPLFKSNALLLPALPNLFAADNFFALVCNPSHSSVSWPLISSMSSLLFLLQKDTAADVAAEIYAAIDSAEALRFQEYEALMTLQCSARRALINRVYCKERRCAIAIARSYRGFLGRTSFLQACEGRDTAVQRSFFAYLATIIQKVYRGHYSRRYKSDFAQRKRFLDGIVEKVDAKPFRTWQKCNILQGEQLRVELDAYHRQLIVRQEEAANLEREQQFEKIAYGLHHLVSTACSPGIFQSPYYQLLGSSCFGVPIEQHLKSAGKGTLRQTLTANRSLYLSSRGLSALGTAGGQGFGPLH